MPTAPPRPRQHDILFERGIPVIPDILANSGGVMVSTFEWEQNLKNEHWTEEAVYKKLRDSLTKEATNVWQKSKKLKTDLRRAAFIVALERLGK